MPTIAQGSDEMESKIDWSKAPEGASHYVIGWGFFKLDLAGWFICDDGEKVWRKTPYQSPDNFSWWGNAVARPTTPSWSGEGLPPVGVVCEMHYCGEWEKTEILCIGVKHVFIRQIAVTGEAFECSLNLSACQFRPIRTPEQIAEDERQLAVNDMAHIALHDAHSNLADFGALYDAGYRKEQK